MGFCDMEILHHGIHQRLQDDTHGTAECDIFHFIRQAKAELTYCLIVLIFTSCHGKHHVPGKDDGGVGTHGII